MLQHAMYEELARERIRVSGDERRREYARRLAVLRRRQRRLDAARRAVRAMSV
jgi:hypothetical protein